MTGDTRFSWEDFQASVADLPPSAVVISTAMVDTICEPIGCGNWRTALPETWQQGWFDQTRALPFAREFLPSLMTYQEFVQQTGKPAMSVDTLQQFGWETSSTTLGDVTSLSSMAVLLVLVMILRAIKSVLLPFFSSIGRKAGRHTHGVEWERNNEIRIVKFGEYVFRLCFHFSISVAGIVYFWDKSWWQPGGTPTLWEDWPKQEIEPSMTWYYLIQSAYNIDAMLSLLILSFAIQRKESGFPFTIGWSKDVRGDFQEMFIHHIVTNALIMGSSYYRLTRIGSMVFLVHDISDVPVDLSKLANFLKWKRTTAACFALMVLVWCMTRLGVLPFVIYKSTISESWACCNRPNVILWWVFLHPIFLVLLGLLILLHLAWFFMFLQMGWVLVSKGEAHDLSEHKKGEEETIGVKKQN